MVCQMEYMLGYFLGRDKNYGKLSSENILNPTCGLLDNLSCGLIEGTPDGILEGKYVGTSDEISNGIFVGGREGLSNVID